MSNLVTAQSSPQYPWAEHYVDTLESGATVGTRWHVDAEHSVWCGEISRRTFDELDPGHQATLANDCGWFIVLYAKTRHAVLGRALDEYQGRDIAEVIALGLIAHPDRIARLLDHAGGQS